MLQAKQKICLMLCSESQQRKRQNDQGKRNGKTKLLRTKKKGNRTTRTGSNSLCWRSAFVCNFLTLGLEFLGYWVNHACLLPICFRTKYERRQSAYAPPTNFAKLNNLALAKSIVRYIKIAWEPVPGTNARTGFVVSYVLTPIQIVSTYKSSTGYMTVVVSYEYLWRTGCGNGP